jgi:hypothetical protein
MEPTKEIIPGFKLPDNEILMIAENQPQYLTLPAWKGPEGLRVTRWKGRIYECDGHIKLNLLNFEPEFTKTSY